MSTGRNLTKHLTIEARQHDLVGIDLGEGPRRKILALGAIGFVIWLLVAIPLTAVTGLLGTRPDVASLIILFPPMVLIMIGFMEDEAQPRRMKVTRAALRLRYITTGHKPVVHLGARQATKAESLTLRQRIGAEHASYEVEQPGPIDRTIKRDVRARLIGNEQMHRMLTQKGNRS